MTTALRPMSTGEVLDRTFNLYRNNFQLFAGIATILSLASLIGALLLVLTGVGVVGLAPDLRNPATFIVPFLALLVGYLLSYLIGYALSLGATIYAVSQVHLGNRTTIKESYRRIRPQMWRIMNVVTSIFFRIVGASFLAYFLIVLITVFAATSGSGWLAAVIGGCGLVVGAIWVFSIVCKYALAVPVCLLENIQSRRFLPLSWWIPLGAALGVILALLFPLVFSLPAGGLAGACLGLAVTLSLMPKPALRRSKELAEGSLFRIFIVLLLVLILNLAFSLGLQYAGRLALASLPSVLIGWNLLAGFIASTLSFPISNIAYSLFYYDQRVRKEAFDLQLMMEAVGQAPPGQRAAAAPSIG